MSAFEAVDHVQLPIPIGDAARARTFYEETLGLAALRDPALERPGTLRYALGAQRLDLCEGRYSGVAPQAHLALRVRGLRALVQRLRARGHAVDTGGTPDAGTRVYVDDPFGNRLELIETLGVLTPEALYDVHRIDFSV